MAQPMNRLHEIEEACRPEHHHLYLSRAATFAFASNQKVSCPARLCCSALPGRGARAPKQTRTRTRTRTPNESTFRSAQLEPPLRAACCYPAPFTLLAAFAKQPTSADHRRPAPKAIQIIGCSWRRHLPTASQVIGPPAHRSERPYLVGRFPSFGRGEGPITATLLARLSALDSRLSSLSAASNSLAGRHSNRQQ